MRITIIDDAQLWINQGMRLLGAAGHEVTGVLISNPSEFAGSELRNQALVSALAKTDVLVSDKDFGEGSTSTSLLCVIRANYPKLPIVRWTGGYEDKPYMRYLGVSTVAKPNKKEEAGFVDAFNKAVAEQALILGGPMAIFAALDEVAKPDENRARSRAQRLEQLPQIAQLATKDRVESGNWEYPWTITGRSGGVTKHELGHCICDGDLTADDIRPHLPALQKVIAKFEAAREIDDRFRICAEFLKVGNLEELELVRRCY